MSEHTIGKFCSVAKKDTLIIPKDIPGYITPEGQVLKEDGQRFNFIYNPIHYNISYDLQGGSTTEEYKSSYTIEDEDYTPAINPSKPDHKFINWTPEKIAKGSIGDVTMVANWKPNAILLTGSKLNKALTKLAGSKDAIMAIQSATQLPENCTDISSTSNPILASYKDGIIYIYSQDDIYCNANMKSAFAGFTILRDISALYEFICKDGTNINSIFKDCALLSDVSPVSEWANSGNFSDFTDAFKGTSALSSGRVPAWYKWSVKMNYISSTGVVLKSVLEDRIPGEVVYPPAFGGYKSETESIEITSPTLEYTFVYTPIKYNINYILNGGEINNQKTEYTIEDETYYPPEAVKPGFKFDCWTPECIKHGEYGTASFVANYKI